MKEPKHSIFYKTKLLDGKKTVVTGAGRGIGKQVAFTLVEQGAQVVILDQDHDLAKSTANLINYEFGLNMALPVKCDISNTESLEHAFSVISDFYKGSLDIFLNSAGINAPCRIEKISAPEHMKKLNKMIEVNQISAFSCAAFAYPLLLKGQNPCFIIMGSCASQGSEGQGGYASTKGALRSLMGTLVKEWTATEYKPAVRINLIEPDYMEATSLRSAKYLEALADSRLTTVDKVANDVVARIKVPMKREGRLIEIAEAVVYLALAEYVNGNVLIISGGKTVRL